MIEMKKLKVELKRVEAAREEMELRIYEHEENIKRLEDNIKVQLAKEEELAAKMKALEIKQSENKGN